MSNTGEVGKLVIKVEGDRSILVDTAEWPLVASAEADVGRRKSFVWLGVRKNADGKFIVYGGYSRGERLLYDAISGDDFEYVHYKVRRIADRFLGRLCTPIDALCSLIFMIRIKKDIERLEQELLDKLPPKEL